MRHACVRAPRPEKSIKRSIFARDSALAPPVLSWTLKKSRRRKREMIKALETSLALLAVAVVGTLAGCSTTSTQAPNISDSLRASLDQAGLKDVSVSQDRDKGVVTLGGHVDADGDKAQA